MAADAGDSAGCAEQISAFMDGELPIDEARQALLSALTVEGQRCWDIYHLIGDILRDHSAG